MSPGISQQARVVAAVSRSPVGVAHTLTRRRPEEGATLISGQYNVMLVGKRAATVFVGNGKHIGRIALPSEVFAAISR